MLQQRRNLKKVSFGKLINDFFWNTKRFDVLLIFGHNFIFVRI
jgi:hypothetical protein